MNDNQLKVVNGIRKAFYAKKCAPKSPKWLIDHIKERYEIDEELEMMLLAGGLLTFINGQKEQSKEDIKYLESVEHFGLLGKDKWELPDDFCREQ